MAGQQGDLPHAHGHRRRRRADRAGPGRGDVRRRPGDRPPDPQVRLPHHARDHAIRRARPTTCRNNLSAAAHLIHGSSEGRFTITYCPGKLTPARRSSRSATATPTWQTMLAPLRSQDAPRRLEHAARRRADLLHQQSGPGPLGLSQPPPLTAFLVDRLRAPGKSRSATWPISRPLVCYNASAVAPCQWPVLGRLGNQTSPRTGTHRVVILCAHVAAIPLKHNTSLRGVANLGLATPQQLLSRLPFTVPTRTAQN